jgi:hypothetical protein
MPSKIVSTFSGGKEEVWFTENDGLMGAYDLKDWYENLPVKIQRRLVSIQKEASSSLMKPWDKKLLTTGKYEVHNSRVNSGCPPLLNWMFYWAIGKDREVAEFILNEWLDSSDKVGSYEDEYQVSWAAVEFHWQTGYQSAKLIRQQGLHNEDLKRVKHYADAVVELLRKSRISTRFTSCKPLDRLFLLHKLMGEKETALTLIAELERLGYQFDELIAHKYELSK